MLILIVSSGPDKGQVFTLRDARRATIGREGDPIKLRDHKASRHHCELTRREGRWYLADASSRHGTHLNQQRITSPVAIDDGDFVQVGRTVLVMAQTTADVAEEALPAVVERVVEDNPATAESPVPASLVSASAGSRSGSRRLAGLVAVVALAVIGLNAWVLWQDQRSSASVASSSADHAPAFDELRAMLATQGEALAKLSPSESLSPAAFDRALADQREHFDRATASLASKLDALPSTEDQRQMLAQALEGQAQRIAGRLNDVEPTLSKIEQQLAARELDPAWREELTGLLERQLELTAGLETRSRSLESSVAALLERPGLDEQTRRLAEAVTEALPEDPTGPAVASALASLRDTLDARLPAQTTPPDLVRQVREAALAEAAEQRQLLRALADRLDARDDLAAQLTELASLVDRQPELLEARLTELLEQQDAAGRLGEVTEALARVERRLQDVASSEAVAAVSARLRSIDVEPGEDRLAATVDAVKQLLSSREDALRPAIDELAAALDQRPSRAELESALGEMRQRLSEAQRAQVDAVAKRMADGPATPGEEFKAVVQASAEAQTRDLRALLDRIAARLADHPSRDELDAALARARAEMTQDTAERFEEVLAAIEQRPDAEAITPLVESALAARPDATAKAIEQLAEVVAAQPTRDEVASLIEATRAATRTDVQTALAQVTQGLEEAGASNERLAEASAAAQRHLTETRRLLDEVLVEVKQRDELRRLAARIEVLAEAEPDVQPLVDEVLAAIERRTAGTDRLLAAAESLEAWPAETREVFEQTLAAVEQGLDELKQASSSYAAADAQAFARVLEGIRQQAQIGLEGLKPGSDAATEGRAATAPAPLATVVSASPAPVSNGTNAAAGPTAAPERDGPLSKLEMAYKLAFETGRPVTVGKSSVDPETGAVSPGRVIDPTAARAAGITHWRDWYTMDDFAERRRLQRLAEEVRRGRANRDDAPLITLPE